MRNLEEEKELVIATGPKISDLPASKDIFGIGIPNIYSSEDSKGKYF